MAISKLTVETVNESLPSALIEVKATIKNISPKIIDASPVMRINGGWVDEGSVKTITPEGSATWILYFIMPTVDALVRVEDWCEDFLGNPWHLDVVFEKIIEVLTQESEFDNLVVTISKGE